jgi:hypothetical protein
MKAFGAPAALLVGIAVAVLAIVVIDPIGAGLAGGILAGALVAVAWLIVDGHKRGVPPGRLAARALVGAVPVLALFSFAALGIGGHEAFDDDATMTGAVVGAIALIAAEAGRITWLRASQE